MQSNFRRLACGFAAAIAIAFSAFGYASPLEVIRYTDAVTWSGTYGMESAKL